MQRLTLFKWSLYVAAVALIVLFLPSDVRFNYQYEVGKPWRYGSLIASYDFPVYKSDAAMRRAADSVRSAFSPYFLRHTESEEAVVVALCKGAGGTAAAAAMGDLPSEVRAAYVRHAAETLRALFESGIVTAADRALLAEEGKEGILVVEGKLARQQRTEILLTEKEAYERLLTADTARFSRSAMQHLNLQRYVVANLSFDRERTETLLADALSGLPSAEGLVVSGQKIVDRGEVVTTETANILESLRRESLRRGGTQGSRRLVRIGEVLFVGLLLGCFFLYLTLFRRDYFSKMRHTVLLIGLMTVFPIVSSLMVSHNVLSVHIVPFAMVPIIVRVFMDSRTAFTAHVITILLASIPLRLPYEFVTVELAAGLVAIFSLRELSERSQLFRAALMIVATLSATYFAYELMQGRSLSLLSTGMYVNFIINGTLLLLTYPLLFVMERLFSFTSNVTLVELSNVNNKLLREMSEIAPGTFQHSMQVANLAAAAANSVGAKSQLVRTGALYHDIGKMENPAFFTENQTGVNPHESLSEEQSAAVVINHVAQGLRLAERYDLPDVIRDFIATHHGAGKAKYFYNSYCNAHPDETVDAQRFSYPGPNPQTKEQAILMMADAVEAASRSLSEHTEESISGLVNRIIDGQMADGFVVECPLTYREVATVKGVFKEKLRIAYHTRIKYPELNTAKS